MPMLAVVLFLVTLYGGERVTRMWRKATLERRRAKAEYPLDENDPIGRTVV